MNGREWLRYSDYQRQRERDELAARRQRDAQIDPESVQAWIAWMNAGRPVKWEQFRREWIQRQGSNGRTNPESTAGDA